MIRNIKGNTRSFVTTDSEIFEGAIRLTIYGGDKYELTVNSAGVGRNKRLYLNAADAVQTGNEFSPRTLPYRKWRRTA